MFQGAHGIALHAVQGNRASSRVDLRYMELLRDSGVTSGSLCTCDSVLVDCLEIHQASSGSLHVLWG